MAQLDRALGYGPGGWGFESLWAYHLSAMSPIGGMALLKSGADVAQLVEQRIRNA